MAIRAGVARAKAPSNEVSHAGVAGVPLSEITCERHILPKLYALVRLCKAPLASGP